MDNQMSDSIVDFWQDKHLPGRVKFLSNSHPETTYLQHQILDLVNGKRASVMEIGVGTSDSIKYLSRRHNVTAVDICSNAIEKVKSIASTFLTGDMPKIGSDTIDFGLTHLVLQHCKDDMVDFIVANTIRVLKPHGVFSFHWAVGDNLNPKTRERLFQNGVEIEFLDRKPEVLIDIVTRNNGLVDRMFKHPIKMGKNHDMLWYFFHVKKNK